MRFSAPILLAGLLLASGCTEPEGEDFFYVHREGADMPVRVVGNLDSDVMVVVVHGGPGFTGLYEVDGDNAYTALAADYAVAVWDQRGSGAAQGNPDDATFTIPNFVEDVEHVVAALKDRYEQPQIFMLGHSWGGGLGTAYLAEGNNQAEIAGWIEVDGSHNVVDAMPLSRQYVLDYAKGRDERKWEKARDWYAETPEIAKEDLFKHARYVTMAGGYTYNEEPEAEQRKVLINELVGGHYNGLLLLGTSRKVGVDMNIAELDLRPEMARIQIPSLILWGRHDGILPAPMAQDAYDHLGTPEAHKSLRIFENSAHSPHVEEADAFEAEVRAFIERYRTGPQH